MSTFKEGDKIRVTSSPYLGHANVGSEGVVVQYYGDVFYPLDIRFQELPGERFPFSLDEVTLLEDK